MKVSSVLTVGFFLVSIALTSNSQATILLSDNFDGTGNPNTLDVNFNLAGRQAGSSATQSWDSFVSNAQVGNSTPVGQPPGTNGDYLLLAFTGKAALTSFVLNSTTVTAPLLISFDMFNGTNAADWTSFTLTSAVPTAGWEFGGTQGGFPIIADNAAFGFAKNGDGTSSWINIANVFGNVGSPFTTSGDSFSFLLSDTAGTGSAWGSGGSQITVKNGATTLGTYTFAAQLTTSYITFGANAGQIGGIDNLVVTSVPEPTTWAVIVVGLCAVIVFRRLRTA